MEMTCCLHGKDKWFKIGWKWKKYELKFSGAVTILGQP